MTGIEMLRDLASDYISRSWSSVGETRGRLMLGIADQIERERACDVDTVENVRLIVGGVIDEMEQHVSGVEGAEDSPVARWARELRDALKSDASDSADAQKPSCADPDGTADVTSEAAKVTRDPAEDVSMSAYDLLPADERDAIAWVREHGGIGGVERAIASLNDRIYRRQRQIDESHEALRRRNERIGFLVSELNRAHNENREEFMRRAGDYTAFADEVCKRLASELRYVEGCSKDVMDAALHALDRRLMPEGMEWLVEAWPRFEDDAPVKLGDIAIIDREADMVEAVQLWIHGRPVIYGDGGSQQMDKGERVKRPAPKVLDADGIEIREGDTVYSTRESKPGTVVYAYPPGDDGQPSVKVGAFWHHASELTHRAPVLAADGKPLSEGETVYDVEDRHGYPHVVVSTELDSLEHVKTTCEEPKPASVSIHPSRLTHERPDSWERLEEDAANLDEMPCDYNAKDIVRRAKALAGGA